MKTFKEFITEELLPNEEYDARRRMGSGHSSYRESFLQHNPKALDAFRNNPDKKQWTTRVPVSFTEQSKIPHPGVISFLQERGYRTSHQTYKEGIAHTTTVVGDPEKGIPLRDKEVAHKIGGLLEKHDAPKELKAAYTNDSFRTGAKTKDYDIVLTGHPNDIYGGSTGRGWTSCAQMRKGEQGEGGPAAKEMTGEIQNHTHMTYLVPRGGDVDTQAIARMSFKHHTGLSTGHQTLLPEERVYGSAPDGFSTKAKEVVAGLFDKKPGELYKKNDAVYNDNGKKFSFPEGPVQPAHLDLAWKDTPKKDEYARVALYGKVDHTKKYKSTELNSVAKELHGVHQAAATGSFTDVVNAVRSAGYGINEKGHHHLLDSEDVQTPLRSAFNEGTKKFDINNVEHMNALTGISRSGNTLRSAFVHAVAKNLGHATDADHYMKLSHLNDHGISSDTSSRYKIPISDKHTMGRYPLDAIVDKLKETNSLNHDTFSTATLSVSGHTTRTGNTYDQAVHYENKGVEGMSKVVDDLAKKLDSKSGYSSWGHHKSWDDDMALNFHLMKPSTRTRIASVLGVNHVKVMRDGKAGIQEHLDMMGRQERRRALRKANQEPAPE